MHLGSKKEDWKPGDWIAFESLILDGELRLPLGGVVPDLIDRKSPSFIELTIGEKSGTPEGRGLLHSGKIRGPNLAEMNAKIVAL